MAISRRVLGSVPHLTRRPWEDVARELEDFLRKMKNAWADGIPPGFNDVLPTVISAGDSGDSGTELQGWATADHEHPIYTGVAGIIGTDNAEGTSTSFSRADHTHQKLPREFLLMGS